MLNVNIKQVQVFTSGIITYHQFIVQWVICLLKAPLETVEQVGINMQQSLIGEEVQQRESWPLVSARVVDI